MSKPQAVRDVRGRGSPSNNVVIREDRQGGAAGLVVFAGVMMMVAGSFNVIEGLVALLNSRWLASSTALPVHVDYTAWGWTWVIFGSVVFTAGVGALAGRMWARVVGVVFAALNAIVQLLYIEAYPFWALAVVAVDIIVIWALTVHGDELAE